MMGRKNRKAAKYGSPRERKLSGYEPTSYIATATSEEAKWPDLTEEELMRVRAVASPDYFSTEYHGKSLTSMMRACVIPRKMTDIELCELTYGSASPGRPADHVHGCVDAAGTFWSTDSTGATTWLTSAGDMIRVFEGGTDVGLPTLSKVSIPEGLTEDEWHIGEAYARVKKDGHALMAQLMEESYTTEICAYIRAMGWEIPGRLLPESARLLQERDQEQEDNEEGQDPEEMQLW